ncbi:MAG: hypothetical protein ACM3YO_02250, partial [Bacteroidota bacterium]
TEFLMAALNFDSAKATDRILEYGYPTQSFDRRSLQIELDHLLRDTLGKPTHEILMGRVLQQILDLMVRYRVRMPTSFLLLVRVMVTIEGICRQLDPEYMLLANAKPFILGHLRRQFTDSMTGFELLKLAVDWKTILQRFPRKMDDLLSQANAGQLRIEYEIKDLRRLERTLTVFGNKLSFSILVAALVMGGAIAMLSHNGPTFAGIPAFSFVIFLASAVMGLWLLLAILRSGQLK